MTSLHTTVQEIAYTDVPRTWHRLAEALGLTPPYLPEDAWTEFDGDGVLAVHRAYPEKPGGSADLHLLVSDLDAAELALAAFHPTRADMADIGPVVTVRSTQGVNVTISWTGRRPRRASLVAEPIWFQEDLSEPRAILEALGFTAEIASDSGAWVQLAAPGGGSIGLHRGHPRIEVSFRSARDLHELAGIVRTAGFDASVIDQSYGADLHVTNPDGGADIIVNGTQEDLYGYRRG